MTRLRVCTLLILLGLAAGCGDLTRVPPPPVPLSALGGLQAAVAESEPGSAPAVRVRLLRAAPPGALLTFHVPDLAGTIQRFRKTSLHDFLASPEFEEALGPIAGQFSALSHAVPAAGPGGLDPMKLLRALQGEILLSIQDVRFPADGAPPTVQVLAAATVRGAEREAEMLTEFLGLAAASDRTVRVEKGTVGGTGFTRIVGRQPVEYVAEMAVHGDALLLGLGRETVTSAIDRIENDDLESMAGDPSFVRAMERCGDPQDAFRVHVDVQGLVAKLGHLLPEELAAIVQVLGLDRIRAFAGALRIDGKDLVVSSLIDSPGGNDVFGKLLSRHAVNREFFGRIPANATSFSIFPIDGPALLAHLRATLPSGAVRDLEEALVGLREGGIDIERDVFEVFGPRCALVTVPAAVPAEDGIAAVLSRFLSVALFVEIQDSVRAGKLLGRLPESGPRARRVEKVIEGSRVLVYRFQDGQLPMDLALCCAQADGHLVLALSEDAMQRALGPRDPDAAQRYRDLFRDAPETASVVSYEDMRHGLGPMMEAVLGGLVSSLAGGPPARQPTLSHLTQDFHPEISYTVSDDRGTFTRTRSPTGGIGSAGGLSGLFVTASIAIPSLAMARSQANEADAVAALRGIQSAQATFRANAARDADGDGDGEFGFLCELLGQRRPGERRLLNLRPILTGFAREGKKPYERQGYYFRVYLPAEDGSPIGDDSGAQGIASVDGDLAESVMVVVAWPVRRSATGRRAFLLDAQGNLHACPDGPYGGASSPSPDVLSSQAGNLASAPLGAGETARDGYRWVKVRE